MKISAAVTLALAARSHHGCWHLKHRADDGRRCGGSRRCARKSRVVLRRAASRRRAREPMHYQARRADGRHRGRALLRTPLAATAPSSRIFDNGDVGVGVGVERIHRNAPLLTIDRELATPTALDGYCRTPVLSDARWRVVSGRGYPHRLTMVSHWLHLRRTLDADLVGNGMPLVRPARSRGVNGARTCCC